MSLHAAGGRGSGSPKAVWRPGRGPHRSPVTASVVSLLCLVTTTAEAQQDPAIDEARGPCRGDACTDTPPEHRRPLLVPIVPAEPPAPPGPKVTYAKASRYRERGDVAGPRLTFGRTFTQGIVDGFYGRVDTELWAIWPPGMISVRIGLEGWGSADGGGGGIPWAFGLGAAIPLSRKEHKPRLIITGELGWEWAFYDRLRRTGQFGIFAPIANALFGVDLRGVRLLGEASAQYRWGWGGPDRSQFRVGGSLSFTSELWDGPSG